MSVTKIRGLFGLKPSPAEGGAIQSLVRKVIGRGELTPVGGEISNFALRPYRRPFNWGLFTVSVIIPVALGTLYFGLIETKSYVSYAQLTVRSGNSSSSSGASLPGIASVMMGGSSTDSSGVVEYMTSNDIVDELQERVNLRDMWSAPGTDFIQRLSKDASAEDLHRYFNWMVTATLDSNSGLIDLEVQAFRPGDALRLANAIIDLSDKLVDAVAERERDDMVRFAESEAKRAHAELIRDEMAVQDFRTQHSDFDPGSAASSVGALTAGIEQELATDRAELVAMRTRLAENSVPVKSLEQKISSLEEQLQKEQLRLTNPAGGKTYATEASEFQRLQIEVSLAQTIYSSDSQALVTAEQNAAQKHLYLVSYVAPNLPQACALTTLVCDSVRPNRLFMITAVIVCSLVAWGILSLLWAAIREHGKG